jgi:hypothetical protein
VVEPDGVEELDEGDDDGIEEPDDGDDGGEGIEGGDGIAGGDGIDDGDGIDGGDCVLLVAQPASNANTPATTPGSSADDRMFRSLQPLSLSGNCATAWRSGCRPCPARAR